MEIGTNTARFSDFYSGSTYGAGSNPGDFQDPATASLKQERLKARDSDGNPYYDDPKHSNASMPLLGYRRDELLEMGVGSDAAQGIAGLGESLSEFGEQVSPGNDSASGSAFEESAPADGSREDLKAFRNRDQEVRAHEMAHLSAAGSLARGGMQLSYQIGPDGKPYAVGGSVQIDTSKGTSPEETLVKAAQIEAAAMAPANPSPQDLKVASDARRMAAEARQEIADEQRQAQAPAVEGANPSGTDLRAEVITRTYGVAVSRSASESAFAAVA
ncbi:MAG: putative metalloprotease CJM1_0395 family protein [Verrucomicrobiota bacterium]